MKKDNLGSILSPSVTLFFKSLVMSQKQELSEILVIQPTSNTIQWFFEKPLYCVACWLYHQIYVELHCLQLNFSIIPIKYLHHSSDILTVARAFLVTYAVPFMRNKLLYSLLKPSKPLTIQGVQHSKCPRFGKIRD